MNEYEKMIIWDNSILFLISFFVLVDFVDFLFFLFFVFGNVCFLVRFLRSGDFFLIVIKIFRINL